MPRTQSTIEQRIVHLREKEITGREHGVPRLSGRKIQAGEWGGPERRQFQARLLLANPEIVNRCSRRGGGPVDRRRTESEE